MFQRLRPSGQWTALSTVSPAEFEQLDQNQAFAVDGNGGGTFAPTSPIIIGGVPFSLQLTSGISITGGFLVASGASQILGTALFGDTATFSSTAHFSGFAQFDSAAIFNGAISAFDSTFLHDVTVNGTASVSGDASFAGTSTFNGPVVLAGPCVSTYGISSLAGLSVAGPVNFTGGITERVVFSGDHDATFSASDADVVMTPRGMALTADRVWTVSHAGAVLGKRMTLSRRTDSSGFNVSLYDPVALGYFATIAPNKGVEIIFDGSQWVELGL